MQSRSTGPPNPWCPPYPFAIRIVVMEKDALPGTNKVIPLTLNTPSYYSITERRFFAKP